MRKSRKTDFRQKNETSARLKITFVDMTYPGQRPELPSLSHHFLLIHTCKMHNKAIHLSTFVDKVLLKYRIEKFS